MSNLAPGTSNIEASISSIINRNELMGTDTNPITNNIQQPPHQNIFASTDHHIVTIHEPPSKKKRNLPGNPDPEAEVVALSPKSITATNRFMCEICNKGFQRDQNLQLHRRGHNLPWKLKQRKKNEVVRRKVYICPEPSCVHHEPSRALGDLTGIKKHFSRKHGEKKYKCEKCSKSYAVQSDWKAHSKICGTREYRCDCGTLFSRRDSFITHRAFCDALTEESSRSMTQQQQQNQLLFSAQNRRNSQIFHNNIQLKQETLNNFNHLISPWLSSSHDQIAAQNSQITNPLLITPSQKLENQSSSIIQENPNIINNRNANKIFSTTLSTPPSLMSATSLLQKAAQMGVTMSNNDDTVPHQSSDNVIDRSSSSYHHHHVGAQGLCATSSSNVTAGLPSREGSIWHGLASLGNKMVNDNIVTVSNCMQLQDTNNVVIGGDDNSFLPSSSSSFAAFDQDNNFNGIFNPKRSNESGFDQGNAPLMSGLRGANNGTLTRDFLGLRSFPHDHKAGFMNVSGLDQMGSSSSSYDHQQAHEYHLQWQS